VLDRLMPVVVRLLRFLCQLESEVEQEMGIRQTRCARFVLLPKSFLPIGLPPLCHSTLRFLLREDEDVLPRQRATVLGCFQLGNTSCLDEPAARPHLVTTLRAPRGPPAGTRRTPSSRRASSCLDRSLGHLERVLITRVPLHHQDHISPSRRSFGSVSVPYALDLS